MSNTSTVTLDGKGIARPPVVSITTPAEDRSRVIFVTRFGLAVVGFADKTGAEVRHV